MRLWPAALILLFPAPADALPRLEYAYVGDEAPPSDEEPEQTVFLDRMEYRGQRGGDGYHWDLSAQFGGERHGLFLSTTGDGAFSGDVDYWETQALYSRAIGGGMDLLAGVRADLRPDPRRLYLALGTQGDVTDALYGGAFAYVSHKGELTGRLFALYDIPLAGRFVLQPSAETEIAAAHVPELGIGAGPIYAEAALRLRYQVSPAFAPYAGINWERLLGRTRRMAREAGEDSGGWSLILGLRSWF